MGAQEGSFNVGKVLSTLNEMQENYGTTFNSFVGLVPGRHRATWRILQGLRQRTDLFVERKSYSKVPIFSLTDKGCEIGQEQISLLSHDIAHLVGLEFTKILPPITRK